MFECEQLLPVSSDQLAQLPSAELPILETRRPPELIFIPIMEQVPPGGADLYGAPDAPATIAEALKQRMEKYQARLFWIF